MDTLELYFRKHSPTDRPYEITISEEDVTVYGCDCADTMDDAVVVKVYEKLGEYLKFKGLISEST